MTRQYPNSPVVGVGVVVWRGEDTLLIRRGRPPGEGNWSLAGGAQELGETVFEAARREVMEETNLAVEVLALIDVVDSIRRDDDGRIQYHYTLVDVLAEWRSGDAQPLDDAAEVAWVPFGRIGRFELWSETRRIIRLGHQLRESIAGGRSDSLVIRRFLDSK